MIRVILIAALTLVTAPVLAQSVTLRTGEHGSFTRIVLDFDQRPDWSAGRTPEGYAMTFDPPPETITGLDRAFDLITRDRVLDLRVSVEEGLIEIPLSCDCWAEISEFREDALIIDIRPGPPPDAALHEDRFAWPTVEAPAAIEIAFQLPAPAPIPSPPVLPSPHLASLRPPAVPVMPAISIDTSWRPPPQTIPTEAAVADGTEAPAQAVTTIASEIARAVAQGLLEPEAPLTPLPTTPEARPTLRNLSVDTAVDAALGFGTSQRDVVDSSGTCIPAARIDVSGWGPDEGLASMGKLRRDAISEDGSLTNAGLLSLSRAYVYLGFGAEARAHASLLPAGLDREVILALADIVDHGSSEAEVLDGQLACAAEAAVWRALARPFEADDLPREVAPILATFSALPASLRVHLGTVMAERFRRAGFPAESRIALNTVARGGNVSIEQMLTVARLDLTGTRAEDARGRLETLAIGTGLTAAEALLELLDDASRRGVPPDPAWVDDAPSLVRATRGTDVARSLSRAALHGGVALDRFDAVRRTLAAAPTELTVGDVNALLLDLMTAVLERGDDAPFLKTELLMRDRLTTADLPDGLRLGLLSRFVDLGLPNRALSYATSDTPGEDERVVIARAQAATGDYGEALATLGTMASEAANLARAEILSISGEARASAEAFLALQETARGTREAIRAADWSRVTELVPPAGNEPGVEADFDDTETAPNLALLADVASRRETLSRLLDLTEVD